MNDNLLPCPFCGCTEIEIHSAGKPFYFAICTNVDCEAEGPVDRGESGAIEKWNTRAERNIALEEVAQIVDKKAEKINTRSSHGAVFYAAYRDVIAIIRNMKDNTTK